MTISRPYTVDEDSGILIPISLGKDFIVKNCTDIPHKWKLSGWVDTGINPSVQEWECEHCELVIEDGKTAATKNCLESYTDLHDGDGVRPCMECGSSIREGWITEDGNGPWCSPKCMGWDSKTVLVDDLAALDKETLYWTEWTEGDYEQ